MPWKDGDEQADKVKQAMQCTVLQLHRRVFGTSLWRWRGRRVRGQESADLLQPLTFRSGKDPEALPPLSPDEVGRFGLEALGRAGAEIFS